MITYDMRVREVILLDASANVRQTADGYLVASPRVARTGIQVYAGSELGKPDMKTVRVYRPESEVMAKDAMATIAHRPITNDHPGEAVTAKNWKKYSVGQTGGDVARDGEFIRVPMTLMDAGTIDDFHSGKKELSLGYNARLEWRSGKTEDGMEYDAVQTNIRVNHLAVVDAARGGPKLAIGDSDTQTANKATADSARALISSGKVELKADLPRETKDGANVLSLSGATPGLEYAFAKDGKVYRGALMSIKAQADQRGDQCLSELADGLLQLIDAKHKEKRSMDKTQTILVDSINVEVTDTAAQIINRALSQRDAKITELTGKMTADVASNKSLLDAANAKVAELTTALSTKDAELVTTKKMVDDAKITPAKLDELVKDRSLVVGKARVKLGDKLVADGKTELEIKRQVVDAALGDQAKGWDEVMVAASFATLTADVKPDQIVQAADQMRTTFSGAPGGGRPGGFNGNQPVNDKGGDPYANYDKRLSDAWKGPQTQQ